jgi:hypothetical protein
MLVLGRQAWYTPPMQLVAPPTRFRAPPWALLGGLLLTGCQGLSPPDPYLGTLDATGFAAPYSGAACLSPRQGFGGASGLEPTQWFYLGALTETQLDISNASDPARTPPAGVYQISGCTPIAEDFDPRLDNYVRTEQYPILHSTAGEPTSATTYKPWHVIIPAAPRERPGPAIACNDIKSQRSLENRAGWDRERKVYGQGDFQPEVLASWPYGYVLPEGEWSRNLEMKVTPPTVDQVRSGKVTFKDWPVFHIGTPIMKTADQRASCPFASGSTARYPRFPGDPQADFQFPSALWSRGLLGGYLDGGDLPLNTDPLKCPALVSTGKTCSAMAPCDMAKGEVCASGRCLGRLPLCPVVNDLYVPTNEANNLATGTIELSDMNGKRTAQVLSIFAATPGQPGFSPVCRLRTYDPAKVTCGRKEAETIAPRPLCTASEIAGSPGAVVAGPDRYVHCLFLAPKKS